MSAKVIGKIQHSLSSTSRKTKKTRIRGKYIQKPLTHTPFKEALSHLSSR